MMTDHYFDNLYDNPYYSRNGQATYLTHTVVFEVGKGKSFEGFVTTKEFETLEKKLIEDKVDFKKRDKSIIILHPENYLSLKPSSKKGHVQTCAYDATNEYLSSFLGRRLSTDDLSWYTNHPSVIQEGLKECDTLDVLNALVHPYGVGISQVIIPESAILSKSNSKWREYLHNSPLTFKTTPTSPGWIYDKILNVDPSAPDGIIRIAEGAFVKGPCVIFDVLQSSTVGLSDIGHATYKGPRSYVSGFNIAIKYDFLDKINYKIPPPIGEDFEITLEVDVDNSIYSKTDKGTVKFKDIFGYTTKTVSSSKKLTTLGDCIETAGKLLCGNVSTSNPWVLPIFIQKVEEVFNLIFQNTNRKFKDHVRQSKKPTLQQINAFMFNLSLNPHTANTVFSSSEFKPISDKTKDLVKVVNISKDPELNNWWENTSKKKTLNKDIFNDAVTLTFLWMVFNPAYNQSYHSLVELYNNDRNRVVTIQVALMHLLQKATKVSFGETYERTILKNKTKSEKKAHSNIDQSFDSLSSSEQMRAIDDIFTKFFKSPIVDINTPTDWENNFNLQNVGEFSAIAELLPQDAVVSSATWASAILKAPAILREFMQEKKEFITSAFRNSNFYPMIVDWADVYDSKSKKYIIAVLSAIMYGRDMNDSIPLEDLLGKLLSKTELSLSKSDSSINHALIQKISRAVHNFIDTEYSYISTKEKEDDFSNFFRMSFVTCNEGTSKEETFFTSRTVHKIDDVESNLISTLSSESVSIYLEDVIDALLLDGLDNEDSVKLLEILKNIIDSSSISNKDSLLHLLNWLIITV